MSATMQEVIAAARAGDKQQAQLLLAQYIQANPDDPQGWYLMSQMVDSKARRAAYLSKTLALDPYHERAWAEFYSLPTDVIAKLEASQESSTGEPAAVEATAAALAEEAPDWVGAPADDPEPAVAAAVAAAAVAPPEGVTEAPIIVNEPAPRVQRVTTTPPPQPVYEADAAIPEYQPVHSPAPKKKSNTGLSVLLGLLILATLVVLFYLIYLVISG